MHRALLVVATVGLLLTCFPGSVPAADVAYRVYINGRPLDGRNPSALNHRGVTFIDIVRAVKAFSGLLTVGRLGATRVSIGGRTIQFTIGQRTAILDGVPFRLRGAPFTLNGETYVPLKVVATLASAQYTVDTQGRRALIVLGSGEGFPLPQASTSTDDMGPSAAQALSFTTSATTDATGLHARLTITNKTARPFIIAFPSGRQVAFLVARNGSEVWDSSSEVTSKEPSTLTIEANGSKTITADDNDYAMLGPGRYTLRVRLLTLLPLDVAPISLGVQTPSPNAPH